MCLWNNCISCEWKNTFLVIDGCSEHNSYRTLKLLADNDIFVTSLPAHTFHVLQPLDLSIFSPLKNAFRRLLIQQTITTNKDKRNNIFWIFKYIAKAYVQGGNAQNEISGVRAAGLWNAALCTCDPLHITAEYFNSYFADMQCLESVQTTRRFMSIVDRSTKPR